MTYGVTSNELHYKVGRLLVKKALFYFLNVCSRHYMNDLSLNQCSLEMIMFFIYLCIIHKQV